MPDREKVIKGLEYCMGGCQVSCFKCPYREIGHQPPDCLDNCMILQDAVELLKENESVKPEVLVDTWVCGNCKTRLERQAMIGPNVLISENFNYCPSCGRKVKWDDAY